jgi:hypothetical protein
MILLGSRRNIILSYAVWLTATRTAKLLPHLWYRPQDIIYVPAFIVFGYYFAVMKIYALFTLHEVCPSFPPHILCPFLFAIASFPLPNKLKISLLTLLF